LLQAIRLAAPPGSGVLASRFSSGQTSFPRVLFDVETFLETLYQRGLVLKDGVDNPRPSPELNGSPEKSDSDQNAPTARPVIRSVQEECMTPDLQKETRSVADYVEKLYWEKSYIYKMHVELTYRCNFKCVQCYNTTHKGAEKELSLPEWESALQQLADLGRSFPGPSDILIAAIAVARGRLLSLLSHGNVALVPRSRPSKFRFPILKQFHEIPPLQPARRQLVCSPIIESPAGQ
jgi:hypothetical protein